MDETRLDTGLSTIKPFCRLPVSSYVFGRRSSPTPVHPRAFIAVYRLTVNFLCIVHNRNVGQMKRFKIDNSGFWGTADTFFFRQIEGYTDETRTAHLFQNNAATYPTQSGRVRYRHYY